jgi:adenine phosphoribosyltransferase
MATLNDLKFALRQAAKATPHQPLSDTQYSAGFQTFVQDSGWIVYRDFIIPQLLQLLNTRFKSCTDISVLEIGPGPQSLLAHLPSGLRRKFKTYTALEPNGLFAAKLEEQLQSTTQTESPLPCLAHPAKILQYPFVLQDNAESCTNSHGINQRHKYDLILFCHSMYGMKPKHKFIEQAVGMLLEEPQGGIVVVFHRDRVLRLNDLVCHRTASYPTGVVRVADDNDALDSFATFIAGYALKYMDENDTIRTAWRGICRTLGCLENGNVSFSSPSVMVAFTRYATTLQELRMQVPLLQGDKTIKNRGARLQNPASIVRPTEIGQVQRCVEWALRYGFSLTVIGGSHSGHCLLSNVVSVDMSAFDQVHILQPEDKSHGGKDFSEASAPLVVAEAGCTIGHIIRKTIVEGLTVPLGARPSVGAGLWLQGGIGHLTRLHGLSCDAIVGAVIISVYSGQILCVGHVPSQHTPAGAVRHKDEKDLLWAIRGAGTNFGIVISVTFKAHTAATYLTRNNIAPMGNKSEAERQLHNFDTLVASNLTREGTADAYMYWNADALHLGVTTYKSSTTNHNSAKTKTIPKDVLLGSGDEVKVVDGIGIFETEMYMSGMHGGHAGGNTSSFKRCVFLKNIGEEKLASRLVAAMEQPPTRLCYLHLLHGGGAIRDIESKTTAFGCRDWDFACVITGVWPREQDNTAVARSVERWVYDVAEDLLPLSCGAYSADLGPDPRDPALAARAFGPNLQRLARLKRSFDPHNVLAYACPLPSTSMPKLIVLVTGESCAGKDYCAEVWVNVLSACKGLCARAVSISDETKREYAAATGIDLQRLFEDRAFKEQHRPALTEFFREQVQQRPSLPQEHFLDIVHRAVGVDVLIITGMRDEAPVATLSHLVPESRLVEIYVQAAEQIRRKRRGSPGDSKNGSDCKGNSNSRRALPLMNHRPTLVFDNYTTGNEAAKAFAEQSLLLFLHQDLERLSNMVRTVPNFPSSGIEFCDILGIAQQPGGLALCTSLLQTHFNGDWSKVGAIVCCEVGGIVNASALAMRVEVPLVLIREAGKLPPPTISAVKTPSHISSVVSNELKESQFEIERDAITMATPVVVIDDVLATGKTLSVVLELLHKVGVSTDDITIMVVAEFPFHRGRELLHQRGFGKIIVQSLLVFTGA